MEKKKILVADDDINIVRLIEANLSLKGYEIIGCTDGQTALEKIKTEKPDLLILDVMMPKIDGYTLDLELKDEEETAGIPVIIITGKSYTKQLFDKTASARFIAWFEKPFYIDKLTECVDDFFKKRKK